jgi:hypothetical protein
MESEKYSHSCGKTWKPGTNSLVILKSMEVKISLMETLGSAGLGDRLGDQNQSLSLSFPPSPLPPTQEIPPPSFFFSLFLSFLRIYSVFNLTGHWYYFTAQNQATCGIDITKAQRKPREE